MLNLGDLWEDILFRSGKDKVGGLITPEDYNTGLEVVNNLYQTYLVDQFEQTKQMSSDLRTLIKTRGNELYPPISLNSYGRGDIPEDYRYHARSQYTQWINEDCGTTSEYRSVLFVSQAEFGYRMETSIYWPSLEEPIVCFETDNTFLVRPIMKKFSLTYIRQAATPVFDYDIISGMPVYLPPGETHFNSSVQAEGSPSLSVEPEYPQECYPKLGIILTAYFAIGNRSSFNVQTIRTLLEAANS